MANSCTFWRLPSPFYSPSTQIHLQTSQLDLTLPRPNKSAISTSAGSPKSPTRRTSTITALQIASRTFPEVARTSLPYAKVGSDHGQTEGQGRVILIENAGQKTSFQPVPQVTKAEPSVSASSLCTETLFSLLFLSRGTTIIPFPTRSDFMLDVSSV